jgi:hypothetical protein
MHPNPNAPSSTLHLILPYLTLTYCIKTSLFPLPPPLLFPFPPHLKIRASTFICLNSSKLITSHATHTHTPASPQRVVAYLLPR